MLVHPLPNPFDESEQVLLTTEKEALLLIDMLFITKTYEVYKTS